MFQKYHQYTFVLILIFSQIVCISIVCTECISELRCIALFVQLWKSRKAIWNLRFRAAFEKFFSVNWWRNDLLSQFGPGRLNWLYFKLNF